MRTSMSLGRNLFLTPSVGNRKAVDSPSEPLMVLSHLWLCPRYSATTSINRKQQSPIFSVQTLLLRCENESAYPIIFPTGASSLNGSRK